LKAAKHCLAPVFEIPRKPSDIRVWTLRLRTITLGLVVAASSLTCAGNASAQGFFDLFRSGGVPDGSNAFAPSDDGKVSQPPPLTIIPVNPRAGDTSAARTNPNAKNTPKQAAAPVRPVVTPVPASKEEEEEDDSDILVEHDKPKSVRIALPVPRPGGVQRTAAEVAPIGAARWSSTRDQLPPGVNLPGSVQTAPAPPRLAALPNTQATPRWTMTDAPLVRPAGLRDVEAPVSNMPGVFAPPEARFQCLPVGLKQVLVDTAKRFGHVAILNAHRGRGTGARESYHYRCRAVDFRVRGVPVSTVYAFIRNHPNVGGRKIYPMGFFHIDDGPVRSW
jgi:hypothetical protein